MPGRSGPSPQNLTGDPGLAAQGSAARAARRAPVVFARRSLCEYIQWGRILFLECGDFWSIV